MSKKEETKLKDKLRINGGKESTKFIEYNYDNLLQSIVFFIHRELKDVKRENIVKLQIDLETCLYDKEYKQNGNFTINDEEYGVISVSCKNVKQQCENNLMYNNNLKGLFYVLLHEIYHYLDFMKRYNKSKKKTTPQTFFIYSRLIPRSNLSKYKKDSFEWFQEYSKIKDEIEADEFAFRNLSYFENLYYYQSCLLGV